MGTQVSFTPLYGADGCQPLASLLTVRGFTFLLDCGWDDSYDAAQLAPMLAALPRIDAVLLSHADMAHMGALAYLAGKGLQVCHQENPCMFKMGALIQEAQLRGR